MPILAVFLILQFKLFAAENSILPAIKAQNINGDDFTISSDYKNNPTFMVMSFTKDSSTATTACSNQLEKDYPAKTYSIAVLEGVPFFLKGIIKNAIRSTVPENRKDRFLFTFEGREILEKLSEFDKKNENDAYILGILYKPEGYQIMFKTHGNCDAKHYPQLKKLITSLY
jgi:hypothetical protein